MNKEIAKKETTDVVVPQSRGVGSNVGNEDLLLPRVELTQALSPSVVAGDVTAGNLVNSVTKEEIGKEVEIIPIILEKNWIRWIPREEGGGMLWKSSDPADPRVIAESQWGANGEKPLATVYMNYLCILAGETMPIVVSFSVTSLTAGKQIFTVAKTYGGDLFSRKYKLSAKLKTNSRGSFYILDIKDGGKCDEADFTVAETLYNSFSKKDMNFEAENTSTSTPKEKTEY